MTNKQKYEGNTIEIYSPTGRKIDIVTVVEVIDDTCLFGKSKINGIETAYDLTDGIKVKLSN